MEQNEKRMAGNYEIIHNLRVGDRELVIGEDLCAAKGERYMCAVCQQNAILREYAQIIVTDDYPEILIEYGNRIAEQARKTRTELMKPISQRIDISPIDKAACTPVTYENDIHNKVIVLKIESLRREYQRSTNQLYYCTGGFGASPRSRGSACFCVDLYSGEKTLIHRDDVFGTMEKYKLPNWAKEGLERYQQEQKKQMSYWDDR